MASVKLCVLLGWIRRYSLLWEFSIGILTLKITLLCSDVTNCNLNFGDNKWQCLKMFQRENSAKCTVVELEKYYKI